MITAKTAARTSCRARVVVALSGRNTTHRAGRAMSAALYLVDVARPAATAARIDHAICKTSKTQREEKGDEHKTRGRYVGDAEMRITHVQKCQRQKPGGDECCPLTEKISCDAKEHPDGDHSRRGAQHARSQKDWRSVGHEGPNEMRFAPEPTQEHSQLEEWDQAGCCHIHEQRWPVKKARIEVAAEYADCDGDDGLFVGPA